MVKDMCSPLFLSFVLAYGGRGRLDYGKVTGLYRDENDREEGRVMIPSSR